MLGYSFIFVSLPPTVKIKKQSSNREDYINNDRKAKPIFARFI
jgi:hypothetical protein